jgi:hypothetical protein
MTFARPTGQVSQVPLAMACGDDGDGWSTHGRWLPRAAPAEPCWIWGTRASLGWAPQMRAERQLALGLIDRPPSLEAGSVFCAVRAGWSKSRRITLHKNKSPPLSLWRLAASMSPPPRERTEESEVEVALCRKHLKSFEFLLLIISLTVARALRA